MSQTLYIIDGHAQIYRAYFAIMGGLTSPTGEPTNATFGFVGMLLKLYQQCKPTHVVVAMDAGSSGRETLDAQYKAQRKPMPEDMPVQIERITQIVETLGIPVYRAEGFEADDVIATMVRQIRTDPKYADAKIFMCTKDKDLDQLIDAQTVMFDIQTNEKIDPEGLLAKKGYLPTQARDVLALTGDTVDNIAGIPGVGPKTAAKWIKEYGTLDNLIANKDKIGGKIGEAFRANVHVLDQSRKLVELQFDVPIGSFDWAASSVKPELLPKLAPLFQQLGFSRLTQMLEQVVQQYRASGAMLIDVAPSPEPTKKKPTPAPSAGGGGLFDMPRDDAPSAPATSPDEEESAPPQTITGLKPVDGVYTLVNTAETLDAMLAALHGCDVIALDTETDALGAMQSNLCGISLSGKVGTGYYIAVKGAGDCLDLATIKQKLGPLLADEKVKKVGQNLKYDINALRVAGLAVDGVYFDTMVASYVLDSSRLSHGMDALAADLLGLQPIPISDLIGKGAKQISFADVPLDRATHYAAEDADVTLRLYEKLHPQVLKDDATKKLFFDVEMPLVQVLADMEYFGVKIDTAQLKQMSKELSEKLIELSKKIREAAGFDFNHDSPKQLGDVLFNKLKLPVVKKTKTGPSTDITVLEKLADQHPVPKLIVEYRSLTKLKNTYLDTLSDLPSPRTGRVHASFNQTVAETGRLSSSDPNLQNIPIKTEIGRQIRKAFVADQGCKLISADYSQIELRVLAHFCQEPALLEAFERNIDVHRLVAAELNGVPEDQVTPEMRAVAKTVNFGIIYGQTGFGLSQVLKIPQDQANAYITAYRRRFPRIEQFTHECIQQASVYGFVATILGRRRAIPDINSAIQARRQFGQRAALNSVIQGSAADLIKLAMVNLHRKLAGQQDDVRLIMQIHDELVFECCDAKVNPTMDLIQAEMTGAMKLKVPLKVDIEAASNWLGND